MSGRRARAGGAALVIAMLLAALAAAVTVALATGQERWRAMVMHRRDQVQAEALAQAGVQWARSVVDDDAKTSSIDTLNEVWALPLPATPVANGSIEGHITDAQGLLNLNNLAIDGTTAATARAQLTSLFTTIGVAPGVLDAIADSVDSDDSARAGGAEDAFYARATPPRVTPDAPALRVAEFAATRGITPAMLRAMADFVTALPPPTTLNVNTAPAEVLMAALPGLDRDGATALVAGRQSKPFTTVAELRARLPSSATIVDERAFSVNSGYFLVSVDALQGETRVRARALLQRSLGKPASIVWQVIE
ncbi:MAG: type II secretion system minor pseudopilin GspK [Casimicrobiaceae bacterium]